MDGCTYPLCDYQRVVYQLIQAKPQVLLDVSIGPLFEGDFGGVVEEVCGAEDRVFGVLDDGGFEGVEGEHVCYFVCLGVLGGRDSVSVQSEPVGGGGGGYLHNITPDNFVPLLLVE